MKKFLTYSICVCLVSWAAFGIYYLASGGNPTSNKIVFSVVESLYMFFPLIVAVALQLLRKESLRSTGFLNFKLSWEWLVSLLVPLFAVVICIMISALMPGVKLDFGLDQIIRQFNINESDATAINEQFQNITPGAFIVFQVVVALVAGCTVNALFAFGEEYGWRNYLVDALKDFNFLKKALLIGLVWGIWHAPLILLGHNYPQHPVIGVGMMCVFCILLGIIELYFVLKTHSVFPAAIFHGTINALDGIPLYFITGGSDLTVGLTGLSGFIAFGIIITCIFIFDRFLSWHPVFRDPTETS